MTGIEEKFGNRLPKSLKEIYLISNGGHTQYTNFLKDDKCIPLFQDNTLFSTEDWECIGAFIKAFQIDDDELLNVNADFSSAKIICRIRFEYFVLYIPEKDSNNAWIAKLDLASAMSEKPKVEFICSSDELVSGLCKSQK